MVKFIMDGIYPKTERRIRISVRMNEFFNSLINNAIKVFSSLSYSLGLATIHIERFGDMLKKMEKSDGDKALR